MAANVPSTKGHRTDNEWNRLIWDVNQCQYVRWCFPDIHGVMRGKIIPSSHCERFFKNGKGAYPGTCAIGPANEDIDVPELKKRNYCNGQLKPDPVTFHQVPWSGGAASAVGGVICNFYWADGSPVLADCRHAALRQITDLAKEGFEISSSFEYEFRLFKEGTHEPIARRKDPYSMLLAFQNEGFLLDMEKNLRGAGIDIEQIHSEYGSGQYEATMPPQKGIKAADDAFIFREGVREIALQHGITASFMGLPIPEETGSGCHYNHSLWSMDGNNVMHDADSEDGMSQVMRHWVGGLIAHSRAIAAFCSPTVNCYRRLHRPWAPDYCDWGFDDRMASYRIKTGSKNSTYVENRQPSSCINAYSVMAATIAAGLDGIRRKLPLPAPSTRDSGRLPFTLQEALEALQEDKIMVDALGEEFIEWFVVTKNQSDLPKLGSHNMQKIIPEELEAELEEYLIYL